MHSAAKTISLMTRRIVPLGTNTGSGGTGNAVRISGFERWTIGTDGLIAASQGNFDEVEYRRQLNYGVDDN